MDVDRIALLVVGALLVYAVTRQDSEEDIVDSALTAIDEITAVQGDNENMQTSISMLAMLKRREKLVLTRYELGDGGYTWGYGHFSTNPNALPLTLTRDQAETIFVDDVVNRGEKWVKLYVRVPLAQNEFDALVSVAFNMSPQSFKKFAAAVNAGEGIEGMAAASIAWVADKFKNGIRNRRNDEIAVFNEGMYA
jgi:lysozyme